MKITDEIRVRVIAAIVAFARTASGNNLALAIGATTGALAILIKEVEGDQSEIARLALRKLQELGARW